MVTKKFNSKTGSTTIFYIGGLSKTILFSHITRSPFLKKLFCFCRQNYNRNQRVYSSISHHFRVKRNNTPRKISNQHEETKHYVITGSLEINYRKKPMLSSFRLWSISITAFQSRSHVNLWTLFWIFLTSIVLLLKYIIRSIIWNWYQVWTKVVLLEEFCLWGLWCARNESCGMTEAWP